MLPDTRAAAQHDLVPVTPENDAIFTHMMRSLEKLTRAHGQAPSDSDRAIYQHEIDCHLAMITVSLKLYITKGRHHMGNLRSYIDVVLQQVKRAKNLQEILNMTKKFCMPPQRDRKYANFRNSRSFIMSDHSATITWGRGDATFSDGKYSRAHRWQFDGGISVIASASPDVVPLPFSRAYAVDPEEAFVGTLASCHMLWFLDLARQATFIADSYRDQARGEMRKTDDGRFWIQAVHLHPQTSWQGDAPDPIKLSDLHHLANDNCFIADSVKSDIVTHLGQS